MDEKRIVNIIAKKIIDIGATANLTKFSSEFLNKTPNYFSVIMTTKTKSGFSLGALMSLQKRMVEKGLDEKLKNQFEILGKLINSKIG